MLYIQRENHLDDVKSLVLFILVLPPIYRHMRNLGPIWVSNLNGVTVLKVFLFLIFGINLVTAITLLGKAEFSQNVATKVISRT